MISKIPLLETMMNPTILSIDQGTTSTRAVVYDSRNFQELGSASKEIIQHYPQPGWVEHDAEEIWQSVCDVVPRALSLANRQGRDVIGIGITNQRETIVLWDRATGKPVHRAIVWQDRRTTDFCKSHAKDQAWLQQKTGLVLDPYFSATKLQWMLDHASSLATAANAGKLAAGTIDSFLIARLTGGNVHATDVTNASRTLLFNIHTRTWDDELCKYFGIPPAILPKTENSAASFGVTHQVGFLPDGIPICGVAGDQQAALFGQCGFGKGDAKCTYGTGAFFLLHTGDQAVDSKNRLLTTIAAMSTSQPRYALEGSVFIAGAAVQWLRDGLHLITKSSDVESLAEKSDPQEPVIFIPALVGLGTPHWVPEARGAIFGLTRSTTQADVARATLEGVAFQVCELIEAANQDLGYPMSNLRVDGGMARNDYFMQIQANLLGISVQRSPFPESTALGVAFLASLGCGNHRDESELRSVLSGGSSFVPKLPRDQRELRVSKWRKAVSALKGFSAM